MGKPIRPIRIEGDLAFVSLTRGYETVIDATAISLIEGRNWFASPNLYAVRSERGTMVMMHRVLTNAPSTMQVDHINGDGLDNRGANLRLATHAENGLNKGCLKNNKIGIKGVSWCRRSEKWKAQIQLNGRSKTLGRFDTTEEAAAAYREAAQQLHGPFARS